MRTPLAAIAFAASFAFAVAACGDDHEESFDNLPDCVADHISLGEPQAIAHCLIDFFDMDFADQAACVAYVTANGEYPNSRDQACTLYFQMRGN
ncbi:MAG TPA: hypothetical protein VM261_01565 [Kofleriaceae bacterium]|nr:hypothetical protein [Kofleriaceae bacterium]